FAPVWWPILAMMVLSAAVHIADILHPTWSRLRSAAAILANGVGLGVVWTLHQGGPLVAVTGAGATAEAAKLNAAIDLIGGISLSVAALAIAIAIAVELWRIARSLRLTGRTPQLV